MAVATSATCVLFTSSSTTIQCQPIHPPILFVYASINLSILPSIHRSIYHCFNQSVGRSVGRSLSHSVTQSLSHSVNQSISQSVSQSGRQASKILTCPHFLHNMIHYQCMHFDISHTCCQDYSDPGSGGFLKADSWSIKVFTAKRRRPSSVPSIRSEALRAPSVRQNRSTREPCAPPRSCLWLRGTHPRQAGLGTGRWAP